jgi:hypothetical protein
MLRPDRCSGVLWCALALLAFSLPAVGATVGVDDESHFAAPPISWDDFTSRVSWFVEPVPTDMGVANPRMESAAWGENVLPEPDGSFAEGDSQGTESPMEDKILTQEFARGEWSWQWMPAGLIYRSYWAGVHEPRMALVTFYESGDRTLWDPTLGGRVGLLRRGDCDPLRPQGFQLDFYGAAIARLDVEHRQDLDSTDYVFGFPLTYGVDNWQFKLSYAHISSHLGDELALRDPDTLDERVNYVRDAIVLGTSYYPHAVWRQYAEVGWAFHNSGGAQPWEAQFGSELSLPGPTGPAGTPFLAVNGRMREEHDFGGDVSVQVGWLRRGVLGQTLRFGAHYYNGKSSQFQFFDNFEEQIGLGVWYDF